MDVLTPRLTRGAKPPPGGFCFSRTIVNWGDDVSPRRPRTRVYIDGFNFYYAAFRRARFQQYKWPGFTGKYEVAVVVSNDADLLEPVRLVRAVLGLPVGVLKVEGGGSAPVSSPSRPTSCGPSAVGTSQPRARLDV